MRAEIRPFIVRGITDTRFRNNILLFLNHNETRNQGQNSCGDKGWRNNTRERGLMLYQLSYRTRKGTTRPRTGNLQIKM